MADNLWREYLEMPPVTRAYTTACVLTTLAVVRNFKTFIFLIFTKFSTRFLTLVCCFQQLEIVTPFHLYFNPTLIFTSFQVKGCFKPNILLPLIKSNYFLQLWRLVTSFCFFGTFGFSFLFNMIFTYRYCRMLEEGSFRNRTADFVFMFVIGASIMIVRYD